MLFRSQEREVEIFDEPEEAGPEIEEEVNQNVLLVDQPAAPPPMPRMADMFQQMVAAMTEAFRAQARGLAK